MPRSLRTLAALCALSLLAWLLPRAFDARAGTVLCLDLAGLVREASACLEARVLASRVELDALGRPCTRVSLQVQRDLLGAEQGTLEVLLPGGILPDGSGLALAGMPTLAVGEELLLFLSAAGPAGLRVPVGLAQGKFRIVRDPDGRRRLSREAAPLERWDLFSSRRAPAGVAAVYDYAAAIAEIQAAAALKASSGGGK